MLILLQAMFGRLPTFLFDQTRWVILAEALYLLLLFFVCLRIVYDTRSVSKSLAYLLFAIFVPFVGMAFYFSFGINYRKRKIYSKKLLMNEAVKYEFQRQMKEIEKRLSVSDNEVILESRSLIRLLSNPHSANAYLLPNNDARVLNNGEEAFPMLIAELQKAKCHIHMEYYIFEDDGIGNEIKDILIEKARQGVEVRFIYDDFGSKSIRRTIVRELRAAGVKAFPFNEVKLIFLANRLNYRNHRKIVVIDGLTSFTGGINIGDRYRNVPGSRLYWRDCHVMIKGYASLALQQVFLSDWNFCSGKNLKVDQKYFPPDNALQQGGADVQVVSSGPDSDLPYILYSVLQSIKLAKDEILLTTPYYIPDDSLQESLIIAALSGVTVKLLVPRRGDSRIVNLAGQAYFEDLLRAGVQVYLYGKGFVHSKTFVVDRKFASIGTANLDLRSFDLNFENSVIIYDEPIARQLADVFDQDLRDAEPINYGRWARRSNIRKFVERLIRLVSPFM